EPSLTLVSGAASVHEAHKEPDFPVPSQPQADSSLPGLSQLEASLDTVLAAEVSTFLSTEQASMLSAALAEADQKRREEAEARRRAVTEVRTRRMSAPPPEPEAAAHAPETYPNLDEDAEGELELVKDADVFLDGGAAAWEEEEPESAELDLSGLDDEELDSFLLTEEEVRVKERVWIEMNREYLEAIVARGEQAETGEKAKSRKRRKSLNKPRDTTTAHGETAAESVRTLLKKNAKYSKRINYDALKDLFGDEGVPSGDTKGVDVDTSALYRMSPEDKDEEMVVVEEEGGGAVGGKVLPEDEDAEGELEGSDKGEEWGPDDTYEQEVSYPDPEKPQERKEIVVKLLSKDPGNYDDAPTEGIRRILEIVTGEKIPKGSILDTSKIDYIRLSTTVATNALLERKGHKHALLITKGFKDVLLIGNQARPRIFDLNIRRPPPLYSTIVEVDERVTLVGYTSDPQSEEHKVLFNEDGTVKRGYRGKGWDGQGDAEGPGEIVQGISGEAVRILTKPDENQIKQDLQRLYDDGYRSLAVVFAHSYTFPAHELLLGELARSVGFMQISLSSQLLPMIKMVPRGVSSTADAYLTPILRDYLDGFFQGFDKSLHEGTHNADARDEKGRAPRVEFMGSDGGLVDVKGFSGLKSILSGPAGGVVGYALTSWDEERKTPIIGLDVGGTSTDVSRFSGRYEVVYETTTAGVTIQSPQLDINTVAAGGGSCLTFRNGLFNCGPESAGADPGPACYRRGGPLAVTDANLLLGRIIPSYFPKIFGKNADEPPDAEASKAAFEKLAKQINEDQHKHLGLDEIVYGFIKVANETMCRPIRALTEARGYATSKHM
ncbi:hypothetical protein EWM64_g10376, partial [Hericium alpestre]